LKEYSQNEKSKGFTLVEVAIVIIIGSILVMMFSAFVMNAVARAKIETTENRLTEINAAIKKFAGGRNRLPNVAPLNVAMDTANFGREIGPGAAAAAPYNVGGRGGRTVNIGAVPTRSLNLPDEYALDAWGSRFVYAVTQELTHVDTYNVENGAIFVRDSAGNSVMNTDGEGIYLVTSMGADRAGGFSSGGVAGTPCPANPISRENCNNDAIFLSTLLTSDDTYDDYILYQAAYEQNLEKVPAGAVVAFNLANCPEGWLPISGMEGRVVIGAGNYGEGVAPPHEGPMTFTDKNYTIADPAGGFATRYASGSQDQRVPNLPPYRVFLYCQKN
jgi:prepilin-type N-terminal cleavage/methylation domain-containing protein